MRALLAALLIAIIAGSLVALGLAVGLQDPGIGQGLRHYVGRYPLLRALYSLHNAGDGAYDYLGKGTNEIDIVVKPYATQWFGNAALTDFAASVAETTGKKTIIIDEAEEPQRKLGAKLYIYLETVNQDDPETLGKTFNEYGIILYKSALEKFTYYTPDTRNTYVTSTLLHEFGHQIGLEHFERDGCLMTSHAETNHTAQLKPSEVVTAFCLEEQNKIETIRNSF